MINYSRTVFASILILTSALAICAQEPDGQTTVDSSSIQDTHPAQDSNAPYTLRKGDNEFGFWAGGAFKATTVFGGLSDAEANDRGLFLAAFRYGRTLVANDTLALQYTLDAIPVAFATGNIVSTTGVGPIPIFQRETTYGAGLTPLGLQLDFANGSRVHPFVHVNGGGLIFSESVPLPDAGRFAFVGEAGSGLRIFYF